MGKSQPEKLFQPQPDVPPEVPPRTKKKGPALPDKPPHIRDPSIPAPSGRPQREPLKSRPLNLEKSPATRRDVLVAASRAGRERPAERRQREPARWILPTDDDHPRVRSEDPPHSGRTAVGKPRPLLLIPRDLLSSWTSLALWTQDLDGGAFRPVVRHRTTVRQSDPSAVRTRSGSVARSGSLTSRGSGSSDGGGETFPKSVLKKQRRTAAFESGSHRPPPPPPEPQKNGTFNAFATVQL